MEQTAPPQPQQAQFSSSPSEPSSKLPLIIGVLILLVTIGGGMYLLGQKSVKNNISSNTQVNQPTITQAQNRAYVSPTRTQPSSNTQQMKITPSPFIKPTQSLTTNDETDNWKMYTNNKYKFTFSYPPDWILKEEGSNCINITNVSFDTLFVCIKAVGDTTRIIRTGVGAGDILKKEEVQFLNQPVEKNVLVFQGIDKSVLYANGGEIQRKNLLFTLSLDNFQQAKTESEGISITSEKMSDQILSTFEFTN